MHYSKVFIQFASQVMVEFQFRITHVEKVGREKSFRQNNLINGKLRVRVN